MPKVTACGLTLEYELKTAFTKVYLPFAVEASAALQNATQQQLALLGVNLPVIFFNAKPFDAYQEYIEFEGDDEPWVIITTPNQTEARARLIVNTWLTEYHVQPLFPNTAPVHFINGQAEWRGVGAQQDLTSTPVERIDKTEGYTTPQQKGATGQSSQVYINGNHHTLGAVVHELFHTLAHPELGNIWEGTGPNLEEALTEYLTCMATRLFLRTDIQGGLIYAKGVRILRSGIAQAVFNDQDITNLYFFRDPQALKKIHDYYYAEENKK